MKDDYNKDREYMECVKDIIDSEMFKSMDQYIQHGTTTCREHSIAVSYAAYNICKNKNADYRSAARAGLLHDFFLYDWHKPDLVHSHRLHGFTHARVAADNARRYFNISDKEYDMILHHMWPLNPMLPRTKEAWSIIYADKICSREEVRSGIARLIRMTWPINQP